MGEENSYTLVVEWCYKEANFGRKVIPVLYEDYWKALNACHEICEKELSHFEQINGKGTIEKLLQCDVPFEPWYEMWCISDNKDEACCYIVKPVIIPAYMLGVPNIENKPLAYYISYYTPED